MRIQYLSLYFVTLCSDTSRAEPVSHFTFMLHFLPLFFFFLIDSLYNINLFRGKLLYIFTMNYVVTYDVTYIYVYMYICIWERERE